MIYTGGPWEIVPTVTSTRRNLFGITKNREYHIGTLVSGSSKDLELFKTNIALIAHAPQMFELMNKFSVEKKLAEAYKRECRYLISTIREKASI